MKHILEYFDLKNPSHLKEYRHLTETGKWSANFWQEIKDLEFDESWQIVLMSKMANEYINIMVKTKE